MIAFHQSVAAELPRYEEELIALLQDTVAGGGSIGFLPPLANDEARLYWQEVAQALHGGARRLVLALQDGRVVGSVQLGLETRANGNHRAEVMKLMVHRSARGQGIGRALMQRVESLARDLGRTLLVLDTRSGDVAEQLYLKMGYQRAGVIPRYARSASGELHDTVLMYRELS